MVKVREAAAEHGRDDGDANDGGCRVDGGPEARAGDGERGHRHVNTEHVAVMADERGEVGGPGGAGCKRLELLLLLLGRLSGRELPTV